MIGTTTRSYYADKLDDLRDVMGAASVSLEPDRVVVDGVIYPIVDDVIVLLDPSTYPESVRRRLGMVTTGSPDPPQFAEDIQRTFGAEWQQYAEIRPEYQQEFDEYFDIVDLASLDGKRVCDLGCGMGRWSRLLEGRCRQLILVDFSDAIFVARRTLQDAPQALFFMADLTRLPFRAGFADFLFCLGVLHHLPTSALDEVRRLRKYADRLLVYLYYALDNKPAYFRHALRLVTAVRERVCRIHSPWFREAFAWLGALGVYLPLVMLGRALGPLGLSRYVPLYSEHHWISVKGHRHHVYDRFFTRIEQRFTREQIQSLQDSFSRVLISDNPGYWHFLCEVSSGDAFRTHDV